ncbi:MAG TPA: hypothetical protein PLY78_08855, partial [Methanospirillum sp.]|nr:hypothetical protein [Methanospirillum sp.]
MKFTNTGLTPYCILLILGITLLCICTAAGSEIISPVISESGYYNTTGQSSIVSSADTTPAGSLAPPVALFSLNQSTGPVPLTVQFTDHS